MSDSATIQDGDNNHLQPLNTETQQGDGYDLIALRRARIIELLGRGLNQSEIAKQLGVDKATISRDVKSLRIEAKDRIKSHIEETLPFEHEKALAGLNEIIKEAWRVYDSDKDNRTKLQALSVVQSAINSRLQALGDPESINRAIRVVAQLKRKISQEQEQSSIDNENSEQEQEVSQVA